MVLVVNGKSLRCPHFMQNSTNLAPETPLMSTLLIPMLQYIVTKLRHTMLVFYKSTNSLSASEETENLTEP
jgi:hypothetical protein